METIFKRNGISRGGQLWCQLHWVPDAPGGRLQPVLMRHPPQLSVKTWSSRDTCWWPTRHHYLSKPGGGEGVGGLGGAAYKDRARPPPPRPDAASWRRRPLGLERRGGSWPLLGFIRAVCCWCLRAVVVLPSSPSNGGPITHPRSVCVCVRARANCCKATVTLTFVHASGEVIGPNKNGQR